MTWHPLIDPLTAMPVLAQAVTTLAIVALLYGVHRLVRYYVGRLVSDVMVRQRYWQSSRNVLILLGIVLIAAVWVEELKTVGLLLTGLVAATFIAAKETLLGLVGRISLSVVHHYEVGDRICVNDVCGDVIAVGLLYTWLLEIGSEAGVPGAGSSTGRVVTVPHLWLTQYSVHNYTHVHDYVWDELELAFSPGTELPAVMARLQREAERLLAPDRDEAARQVRAIVRHYAAKVPPVSPVVFARLERDPAGQAGHAVVLVLRYAVHARETRSTRTELIARLMAAARAHELPLLGMPAPPEPEAEAEADAGAGEDEAGAPGGPPPPDQAAGGGSAT